MINIKAINWVFITVFGLVLGVNALLTSTTKASEASTHFSVFVPPNNDNNGRHSHMVVTAHSDNTTVDVQDLPDDGDSDDSVNTVLSRGQSLIVRIRDGAVNDDAGGKWDGDHFIVNSDQPVTVMLVTRSDWEHDWVPAEGRTMRGQEFFLWAVRSNHDIDVVAYEDNTIVEIYSISSNSVTASGTTTVSLPGTLLLRATLNEGEDLLATRGQASADLTRAGHSYRVVTSKPATVAFGAMSSVSGGNNARDGGGYVPSENGTTVGEHFYFPVFSNPWSTHEREIRIVVGDEAAEVTVRGWNSSSGWQDISSASVPAFGHLDFTGRSHRLLRKSSFYEVISTKPINVFEANWLETGSVGTSDVFTYVSALDSVGASDVGQEFVAYVGPPGIESRAAGVNGTFSHLYVASFEAGTEVTVTDVDTGGNLYSEVMQINEADGIVDFRINTTQYAAMNKPGEGLRPYLRVQADKPVSVAMANWNDNWLAFLSGVVGPEPKVSITGPDEVGCGVITGFEVTVDNDGDQALNNVNVQCRGIGGFVPTETSFDLGTMNAGASTSFMVEGQVPCNEVSTGHLAGIAANASGQGGGIVRANKKTFAVPARVPTTVGVFDLKAESDACSIELEWSTEEDGNVEFAIIRSAEVPTRDGGQEVGRVPSTGVSASGFVYRFRDTTATAGVRYYYYVEAIRDGEALTLGGPTSSIPGDPLNAIPGRTGVLSNDFATVGHRISDPTGDIQASGNDAEGYDVDQIGVAYDPTNDDLYLGVSAVGVFGDSDGDGDPNASSDDSIVDRERFSEDEGFVFVVDFPGGGVGDAVVGIPFGGNLDLIRASAVNPRISIQSPPLAFSSDEEGPVGAGITVDVIYEPSEENPDLQIVVHNASLLSPSGTVGDVDVNVYMNALSVLQEPEWGPSETLSAGNIEFDQVSTGNCGVPTQQIHMGTFAAFGNIFTGTPNFAFAPLGYTDVPSGRVLAEAPAPVPGQVITSPTAFSGDSVIHWSAQVAPNIVAGDPSVEIFDRGEVRDGNFVHISEFDYTFDPAEGDARYENLDVQVFRMIRLDCPATVFVRQYGSAGVLYDDRIVGMADGSTRRLVDMNPALVLAHSGIGTFDRGGALFPIGVRTPDDFLTSLGDAASTIAPNFTHFALLDDVDYYSDHNAEDVVVEPLGENGIELEAGTWFINHYLWTYANDGDMRIETTFVPDASCGGSL